MQRLLLLLTMTFFLGGCAGFIQVKENTVAHIISLDREGETFPLKVNPCSQGAAGTDGCQTVAGQPVDDRQFYVNCTDVEDQSLKCLAGDTKGKQLDANIKVIVKHLDNTISEVKALTPEKKVEVFLFIHGGMVNKHKSAAEAEAVLEAIRSENEASRDKYIYPLFINWESGMMASYGDHLFKIRQGEVAPVYGFFSWPFYFAADLGRAITRLPITFGYQGYRLFEPAAFPDKVTVAYFNRMFYPADKAHTGHGISLGEMKLTPTDKGVDKLTYLFPGSVKLISTPLLDFIGKSAWENMLRRTKTVFNSPNDYKLNKKELEICEARLISNPGEECDAFNRSPGGGAYKLMRALGDYKLDPKSKLEGVEFTLIGHSMGSIVATELLKRFGNGKDSIIFNNIVYMAAAATTKDFQESVIPYLKRHEQTNFYNLTLHPRAEENEKLYDLVPRGSLLVWIDDFASDPATIADMTFGKWVNAVRALPFVPDNVRNRITLKGFGVNDQSANNGRKPEEHSHFNDVDLKFWRYEFWQVPSQ